MGLTFNLGRLSPSLFTDSSLNVGIGAAPSGSYKLEVTGTAKVSSTLLVSGASTFSSAITLSTASTSYGSVFSIANTSNSKQWNFTTVGSGIAGRTGNLEINNNAIDILAIAQTGYVGIGLTAPTNLLCVSKDLPGEAIALINNTSSTGFGLAISSGSATRYALSVKDYQNNSIATFNGNGNVGIGIVAPGEKFTVQTTANNWTGNFIGNTTSGQSLGLLITAGTNSSDSAFYIQNSSGSFNSFKVRGDGWLVSPTTYNNTSGVAANVGIDSAGNIFRATSSIKYKTDIKPYDKGLDKVLLMNPIYYKSISDFDGDKQFAGFIAEEIHELGLNEFVQYNDENNEPEGLNYGNITAILVKAIQELNERLNKAGL